MNRTHYLFKGVFPVLAAAVLWSSSYFIRKFLVIGPFAITFTYCASAAVFLCATNPGALIGLRARCAGKWKWLLAMSLLSTVAGMTAMNIGLKLVNLGVATILEKTQTIFTVIIASWWLGETLARRSFVLGLVGIVATVGLAPAAGANPHLGWQTAEGFAAVAFAALVWSFSGILGRKLSKEGMRSTDMSLVRAVIGTLATLPLMLIFEPFAPHARALWQSWALAALGGVVSGGIGYIFYYHGLKTVSAGVASMLELSTPVISVILGIVFLGERMSALQWVSSAVLMGCVISLILIELKRHHALMEAAVRRGRA